MSGKNDLPETALREGSEAWLREEIRVMRSIDGGEHPVSPETDRRIRRALKRDGLREKIGPLVRGLRAAGFGLVFAAALLFAFFMTVQPVRAAFWEAVVNWYGDAVNVRFTADRPLPSTVEAVRYPSFIPPGWRLESADAGSAAVHYDLTNDGGAYIFVLQAVADEANESWFDGEDMTVETLKVNGSEARLLTHPDGTLSLTWTDEYNFILTGRGVDRETFLRIAGSMR